MTVSEYIERINQRYKSGRSTEHSYRGDLQQLLGSGNQLGSFVSANDLFEDESLELVDIAAIVIGREIKAIVNLNEALRNRVHRFFDLK